MRVWEVLLQVYCPPTFDAHRHRGFDEYTQYKLMLIRTYILTHALKSLFKLGVKETVLGDFTKYDSEKKRD